MGDYVTAMGPQGEGPLTEGASVAYALLHGAPYRFSNLLLGSLRQFYLCGCSLNGRTRNFIVLQEQFPPFEDKPCCEKRSPPDCPATTRRLHRAIVPAIVAGRRPAVIFARGAARGSPRPSPRRAAASGCDPRSAGAPSARGRSGRRTGLRPASGPPASPQPPQQPPQRWGRCGPWLVPAASRSWHRG